MDEDDLCFMGQMKKAKNEVIFSDIDSDSYSEFKPTYKDLQDFIDVGVTMAMPGLMISVKAS